MEPDEVHTETECAPSAVPSPEVPSPEAMSPEMMSPGVPSPEVILFTATLCPADSTVDGGKLTEEHRMTGVRHSTSLNRAGGCPDDQASGAGTRREFEARLGHLLGTVHCWTTEAR